jgi:hypothetical protein
MPKCSAERADGRSCRAWVVKGTEPPVCAAHGGAQARIGAPPGNQNAVSHGVYAKVEDLPADDLGKRIQDLAARIERVGAYIDDNLEDLSSEDFVRFHGLHAVMTSRLARLKKQHQEMGGSGDELTQAIRRALDRLSQEWGVEL